MKNAPWNTDDREILRQKWRLADETASNCEQLLQKIEILRIHVDHVAEGSSEHDELAVEARNVFIAVGQKVIESGLTMPDWNWFVDNRIPDEREHWKELAEHCQQAKKLEELFHRLEEFVRAISQAKRKFADAIKLSLNAWEEPEDSQASWYQRVDEGVRIHGKLVEVGPRDADVLLFLCKRTKRLSTYQNFADLHKTWRNGMDSGNGDSITSQKSSIRTSLDKIRNAIRSTFKLSKKTDPILKGETSPGWRLDKDLLQTISQ